jgi:hypothetical protein
MTEEYKGREMEVKKLLIFQFLAVHKGESKTVTKESFLP